MSPIYLNFEMSFWCLQIPPKKERKHFDLRYHSSKIKIVCLFFGGIEDTIICFRDYLIFSNVAFYFCMVIRSMYLFKLLPCNYWGAYLMIFIIVYVRNHLFGLSLIPKPKLKIWP